MSPAERRDLLRQKLADLGMDENFTDRSLVQPFKNDAEFESLYEEKDYLRGDRPKHNIFGGDWLDKKSQPFSLERLAAGDYYYRQSTIGSRDHAVRIVEAVLEYACPEGWRAHHSGMFGPISILLYRDEGGYQYANSFRVIRYPGDLLKTVDSLIYDIHEGIWKIVEKYRKSRAGQETVKDKDHFLRIVRQTTMDVTSNTEWTCFITHDLNQSDICVEVCRRTGTFRRAFYLRPGTYIGTLVDNLIKKVDDYFNEIREEYRSTQKTGFKKNEVITRRAQAISIARAVISDFWDKGWQGHVSYVDTCRVLEISIHPRGRQMFADSFRIDEAEFMGQQIRYLQDLIGKLICKTINIHTWGRKEGLTNDG